MRATKGSTRFVPIVSGRFSRPLIPPAHRTLCFALLFTAAIVQGPYSARITIADNAPDSPQAAPGDLTVTLYVSQTITVGKGGGYDFETIQGGIDAATSGDTVLVQRGTYTENIDFKGKNIAVRSIDPTVPAVVAATIIDGGQAGPVVTFAGTEDARCALSGFTIRNGKTVHPYPHGAGIRGNDTHAAIEYNVIRDCTAQGSGGGINRCHGHICGNSILNNRSDDELGGGLFECDGTIEGNEIRNNYADFNGGGLALCDGLILDNEVRENHAKLSGGGLYSCDGNIEGNTIASNTTWRRGGGLYLCNAEIRHNVIASNSADMGGGLSRCNGRIFNNLICDNEAVDDDASGGGGGLAECSGEISNNTIAANKALWGAGLTLCKGAIINCILWGNTAPTDPQVFGSSVPSYSCVQGWTGGGSGNISDDPLFISGLHGDYYLSFTSAGQPADSPCVDAGDRPAADLELDGLTTRVDGVPDDGTVDMGYHFPPGVRPPITITVGKGLGYDYDTIQTAIDFAFDGDTVLVYPGVYEENIILRNKNITLRSTDPAQTPIVASTIIDGGRFGSVLTFDGTQTSTCVVAGFTIRNGETVTSPTVVDHGMLGSGIEGNGTHASIRQNVLTGNSSDLGGAICQCDGLIRNNRMYFNFGKIGGALARCNGLIWDNEISSNTADSAGAMWECNGTIFNNLFVFNLAESEGILKDCNGTLEYNTITANGPLDGSLLYRCNGTIRNSILWGNFGNDLTESSTPTYSCIQDWTGGGKGNISDNPLFVTTRFGGEYLSQTAAGQAIQSPCVDAGQGLVDVLLGERTTRTDNVPDTGKADMGYHFPLSPYIRAMPTAYSIVVEQFATTPTRTLYVSNSGAGTLNYSIDWNPSSLLYVYPTAGQSSGGAGEHQVVFNTFHLQPGTHHGEIVVRGEAGNSPVVVPVELVITPAPPVAAVSPAAISVTVEEGEGPVSRTLEVWNAGGGTLTYSFISTPPGFVELTPTSGTSAGERVSHLALLNTQILPSGLRVGDIQIDGNAINPLERIPIEVTVNPKVVLPPDLVLSEADVGPVAPQQLEPGDPLVIGAMIENRGSEPASRFWTEVWGSRTGGLMLDRFLTDSLLLSGGLEGGDVYSWVTTGPLYSVPDGPYTVVYTVDRPNEVAESDELNNRAVVSGKRILVIRPMTDADIAVEDFSMTPNPAQSGQAVTFSGRVINLGAEPTGPFWVEFWGSWNWPYPRPDFFLCDSIWVANLNPGESISLADRSRQLYDVPAGVFMVGCVADRPDEVNEPDETNNYRFIDGQVFNKASLIRRDVPEADAFGSDVTIPHADFAPHAPVSVAPGDTITLTLQLTNHGAGDSGPFWLEYWGSRDGGMTLGEFIADSDRLTNLAPGRTVTFTTQKLLYSIPDGTYSVVVAADRPGEVLETDETNNRHVVKGRKLLTIRPPTQANLVLENLSFGRPFPSSELYLTGFVHNVGDEDSGPFWIEFWGSWRTDYPTLDFFAADSIRVDNLSPRQSLQILSYRRARADMPPGGYVLIGFVDRLDQVNETDETDNWVGFRIGGGPIVH